VPSVEPAVTAAELMSVHQTQSPNTHTHTHNSLLDSTNMFYA